MSRLTIAILALTIPVLASAQQPAVSTSALDARVQISGRTRVNPATGLLEISGGKRSHAAAGIAVGGALGFVAGFKLGADSYGDRCASRYSAGESLCTLIGPGVSGIRGGVIGLLAGALLGGLIGSRVTTVMWSLAHPSDGPRVIVHRSRQGADFGLSLSF